MSTAQEIAWTVMALITVATLSFLFFKHYGGVYTPELLVAFFSVAGLLIYFERKWVRDNIGEDGRLKPREPRKPKS